MVEPGAGAPAGGASQRATPPGDRTAHRLALAGAAALGLFAVADALGYWNVTVDNAFVTMRYAWNLVHGNGLVFNPGERVEGFASPTWVGVMAIPIALGLDPTAFGKVVGIASHALTVVFAVLLGRRLSRTRGTPGALAAVAGGLFVAVSTPANWWAANNLETPFYALLLVSAAWRLAVERDRPGARPLSAILAGLAAVSRPEAPLLALALAAARALRYRDDRDTKGLVAWAGLFAVAPLCWIAVRVGYFGALLPPAWFAKGHGATLGLVIGYLAPWAHLEAPFALAGAVGIALLAAVDRRGVWIVAGVLLAEAVFLAGMGVDWTVNQRFLVPALPMLGAAAGAGAAAWTERAPFDERALRWVPAVALLAVAVYQATRSLHVTIAQLDGTGAVLYVPRQPADWPPGSVHRTFAGSSSDVATWLLARIPPGATVADSGELGLVGYATDWRILDLAGGVDAALSGATGLSDADKVAYVHAWKPDWIVLRDGPAFHVLLLRKAPWLRDEYALELGPRGLWVGRRRDAPEITDAQRLENLGRAVERVPGFLSLQDPRLHWAAAVGTPAQCTAACDDFQAAFPQLVDLLQDCRASVATGGPRPDVTPLPIPLAQMVKTLGAQLPGAGADPETADPFTEAGAYGVGKGWMAVPASLATNRVRLEDGALRLDAAADGPAAACQTDTVLLDGPRRARGQWKVDGLPDPASARIFVRLLDASDSPVGPASGVLLGTPVAATQDWALVDRALDAPADAVQARLCVEATGAGSVWVRGLSLGK